MNSFTLTRGANAIVIAYVRKNGGKCLVHSTNLAKENGLTPATISVALKVLHSRGFINLKKDARNQPAMVILNEEAVRQHEAGALAVSSGQKKSSSLKTRGGQFLGSIPQEVARLLQNLGEHTFTNPENVRPLFDTARMLHSKCGELAPALESRQTEIAKLEEALKGLGMTEGEIKESLDISAEEVAIAIEYEELPVVPVVEFTKLLAEPSSIFKPLATLQEKTRVLRNLLIEIQREDSKMALLKQKMSTLLKERQETEVGETEIFAALADWRTRSDKYLHRLHTSGLAVVSSRE